jgi:hypothetical protein
MKDGNTQKNGKCNPKTIARDIPGNKTPKRPVKKDGRLDDKEPDSNNPELYNP